MHVPLYGSYTRKRYREATSSEIERMLSAPRLDHRTCPPGHRGDVFIAPAAGDEGFWSAWHTRQPQPRTRRQHCRRGREPRPRRGCCRTLRISVVASL